METSWQVSGIEERNAGDGEKGKVWGRPFRMYYYLSPWSRRTVSVWKVKVKVKKERPQVKVGLEVPVVP
jgi:hypothetical protein